MKGLATTLAAAAVILAGCAAPGQDQALPRLTAEEVEQTVVVAFVDSGINPYHEAFRQPKSEAIVRALVKSGGGDFTPVQLSEEGDYASRLNDDRSFWQDAERQHLYWFRGTNVLGITFDPPGEGYPTPMLDTEFHGTAIASVLRQADPGVLMVSVQSAPAGPGGLPRGIMAPWLPEAFEWIAAQAWIDIVFVSTGSPVNVDDPSYDNLVRATRAVAETGKLLLGAAGNTPGPHWTGSWQGPPWFVAVGGVENSTRGSDVLASHHPDVVATYTNLVAEHYSVDGYFWSSGTSYGSPLVAGTLAQALHGLRAEHGWPAHDTRLGLARDATGDVVTVQRLREAMNATAVYWNTTDYNPLAYPAPLGIETTAVSVNTPISPTPWIEMGWGYVGPEVAPTLVEALATGVLPEKPGAAREYMAEIHSAREAYWAARDERREGPP